MKKWECTVCGYIHEGNEPPEECPVCGADKSKFVELEPEKTSETQTDSKDPDKKEVDAEPVSAIAPKKYDKLLDLMVKHHFHPVSVHIPNGVLPVAAFFFGLAVFFNFSGLSQAGFYNLIFVVAALPLVIFTGYIEWRKKYGGNLTAFFITKMICAAVVSLTALILVVWLIMDPGTATASSPHKWSFLFLNLVMIVAAAVAGYLGGKLVFKD